jgi:hypothetical protein
VADGRFGPSRQLAAVRGNVRPCEENRKAPWRAPRLGESPRKVGHPTSKPRPPQPPAQTGALASDTAGKPPSVADNSINAVVDLLNRGLAPGGFFPAAPARAARPAPDPFAP